MTRTPVQIVQGFIDRQLEAGNSDKHQLLCNVRDKIKEECMTEVKDELLPVTQEDREAAANLANALEKALQIGGNDIASIRNGFWDDDPTDLGLLAQAFAAHRPQSTAEAVVDPVLVKAREIATKVSEDAGNLETAIAFHSGGYDEGITMRALMEALRLPAMGAEKERAAVLAWLRAEAQQAKDYVTKFGISDGSFLGLQRALYYEQAAGFIARGDHHQGEAS
jgi:hypothetical protein